MTLYRELRESGAEDTRALVDVERTGERAIVTMNESERLNPLSVGLNLQLQERLSELAGDPTLRAIVLTGADPAFSTGGDLEMMAAGNRAICDAGAPADTTDAWRWIRRQFGGIARIFTSTDKLFVATPKRPRGGRRARLGTRLRHRPRLRARRPRPRLRAARARPGGRYKLASHPPARPPRCDRLLTCAAATSAPKTHSSLASSKRSIRTTSSSPPCRTGASAPSGFRRTRSR